MDMTYWLEYFVKGLKLQMIEVKDKGEVAIKKEIILEKVKKLELNDRQNKALVYLMENPNISRSKYVELCKVSLRTANYDLACLEELNLIEKTGVGRAIKYRIRLG